MASTPYLRNGNLPLPTPTRPAGNPHPELVEAAARLLAARAAEDQVSTALSSPVRTELPREMHVEPIDVANLVVDDLLVDTRGAAIILGVSHELVKKWRGRDKGPDYYQYEERGSVLYSVRALNAYKAAHLITPKDKRGK